MRKVSRRTSRLNLPGYFASKLWMIEALEQRTLLSVNIVVHHGDPTNDGDNLAETVLTPSNVNPTDFGKQFSTALDGPVFAQPLYVQNVDITRGPSVGVHSVVYVATMHDSLYAIDANTGTVLWQDSFLNTADPTNLSATSGVTPVSIAELGNVAPASELGILVDTGHRLESRQIVSQCGDERNSRR